MERNYELTSFVEETYYVLFFENMTLTQVATIVEGNEILDLVGNHFSLVPSHFDNESQFHKNMDSFREDSEEEIVPVVLRYVGDDLETTILK